MAQDHFDYTLRIALEFLAGILLMFMGFAGIVLFEDNRWSFFWMGVTGVGLLTDAVTRLHEPPFVRRRS